MTPDPELLELRRAIDDIDQRILALVSERVKIVLKVGDFKRKRNLPIYDPDRERLMLERLMGHAPEPLDGQTVRHVFERLIDECRRLEQHHTQK